MGVIPARPVVALALGALLLTEGCTSAPPGPDVVSLAVASGPNSFDPRVATDETSQKLSLLIYDNLLALDDQLRVVPALAERWEQPDPTTYLVHLRRGVQFHDGHELTAQDVVFTFASFIDPSFLSARKGAYRLLDRVEAVDRYAVKFSLKEPFGSFPVNLVMPIVPAGSTADLRDHPVGTGPYRFAGYAVDDRVELTRFDDYYAGPARNAGVTVRIVPDDIMRGLELRKGTLDLVINDLSPDIIAQLREDAALQVIEAPGTDYAYVGFNLRDPMLADRRVRQAIAHAIDREAIIRHLRRGLAEPAVGIIPPSSWAFAADAAPFAFDPARGRQLLDEAGYADPDGDGPLPRLRLSLKVSTNEFYRLQAAVIQSDLRAIGIELDVRSYEFATLYADVLAGNFQLFTLQWVGVSDPDMLRRVFHSNQVPPNGFNRGFYQNSDIDRLIDEATVSTDDGERTRLFAEVQRRIADDAPYVGLWYRRNVAVAAAGLTGVRLSPSADFTFLRQVTKTPPSVTSASDF